MSPEIDYSAVEGNEPEPAGIDYSVVEGKEKPFTVEDIPKTTNSQIDYSVVEKSKAKEEEPSLAQIGGGLVAEVILAESAKYAGAAAGSAAGLAGGPLAPLSIPAGALLGYGIGAVTGGVAGSIAAQKIEGRENISYGRVVADTLMNFIPGSKLAKASTVVKRVGKAAVVGAVLAPAAQAIEKGIETGEMPTLDEATTTAATGFALGAGLGLTAEATSRIIGKFAGKSAQELDAAIRSGDPDAVTIADAAMANVDPDLAKPTTAKGFVEEVMNFTKSPVLGEQQQFSYVGSTNIPIETKQLGEIIPETRGLGVQYHGAKKPFELSPGMAGSSLNIYGTYDSLYTTEARDVAKGYQRKSSTGVTYQVTEKKDVKLFDMEKKKPFTEWKNKLPANDLTQNAIDELADAGNKNPSLREIHDEMRNIAGSDISADEVQGDFEEIRSIFEKEGFGGYTHIGGAATGAKSHKVNIYFEPSESVSLKEITPEFKTEKKIGQPSQEIQTGEEAYGDLSSYDIASTLQIKKPQPSAVQIETAVAQRSAPIKSSIQAIVSAAKANIAPSKVLGKDIMQAVGKAEGAVEAGKTGRIINQNIQRVINDSPDPVAAEESAYNYMAGLSSELPSSISKAKNFLDFARDRIAQSQDELIANHYNGSKAIPKETLQLIEGSRNTGDYLTQEYKFFTTPKYQPSEKLRNDLVKSLIDNGQTPKQAEEYILKLNSKKPGGPNELEKFVYSTPGGILKEKKDLSPELRNYLGEITLTGEKIEGTTSKLANFAAYDTADLTIKNILRSTGIAKVAGEGVDETQYTRLNLRRGLAKEGEDDLYVPKHVQTSLNSVYGAQLDNETTTLAGRVMKDVFGTAAGLFKVEKVLASPGAHANQAYGQVVSLLSMGINPFKNFRKNVTIGSSQFGSVASRLDIDNLKFRTRAMELGMLQEGVLSSDIHRSLNQGPIGSAVRTVTGPVGKVFSIADISYRLRAWDANMESIRKIFPQADGKAVEEAAAAITQDTYPNYDKLNKSLRELSTYGAIGQFASFKLELVRNTYNQVMFNKSLMDGSFVREMSEKLGAPEPTGNAALKEGLKRSALLSTVLGATAGGVAMYNKNVGGVDKEKDKALRESVLAPYEQNTTMAMSLSPDGNKVTHTQVSYLMPQTDIVGPLMAASNGGTFNEMVANSFESATSGLEGEGILFFKSVYQALDNYNPKREEKISFKPEGFENKLERIGFVTSQFTPSFVKQWKDTHRAVNPKPVSHLVYNMTGVRTRTTVVDDGVGFKIRSIKGNYAGLSHAYNSAKKQYIGDELNQAYQGINQDYQNNSKDLIKHAANLRKLGKTEDQVISLFRDNGMGATSILKAIDGKVDNLPEFKRVTPTSEFEKLQGKSFKDKVVAIRAVEDPVMQKALAAKLKAEEIMKRSKISEKDKTILGLGTVDGSRAEYLVDIINQSPDPDGTLKQFVKRGLVDQTVMSQIQKLRKTK